jgi:ABC-type multidrug transport system permease subunit
MMFEARAYYTEAYFEIFVGLHEQLFDELRELYLPEYTECFYLFTYLFVLFKAVLNQIQSDKDNAGSVVIFLIILIVFIFFNFVAFCVCFFFCSQFEKEDLGNNFRFLV